MYVIDVMCVCVHMCTCATHVHTCTYNMASAEFTEPAYCKSRSSVFFGQPNLPSSKPRFSVSFIRVLPQANHGFPLVL